MSFSVKSSISSSIFNNSPPTTFNGSTNLTPTFHNYNDYPDPEFSPDGDAWTYPWWFFSLARFNKGGPAFYSENVHLPPDMYLGRSVMGIISAGLTFLLVLLVILPIIKHRIESVIVAVNSVCIGAAISLCMVSPEWLYGNVHIKTPMTYIHSSNEYTLSLGVHIGLACANITLETLPPSSPEPPPALIIIINTNDTASALSTGLTTLRIATESTPPHFFYNERLKMYTPELFAPEMGKVLHRGFPIPLLTIYHFLTSATLGFGWSQDILQGGYHCYLTIIFALTVWFVTLLFIAAIPRYSCYTFISIGCLLIFTNITYFYWVKLHHHFPPIYIAEQFVQLRYGICFWTCLVTGLWSCMYGFTLAVYDVICPDRFLSIFDIDFDSKCALAAAHRMNKNSSTMSLDAFREDEEYHFEL